MLDVLPNNIWVERARDWLAKVAIKVKKDKA